METYYTFEHLFTFSLSLALTDGLQAHSSRATNRNSKKGQSFSGAKLHTVHHHTRLTCLTASFSILDTLKTKTSSKNQPKKSCCKITQIYYPLNKTKHRASPRVGLTSSGFTSFGRNERAVTTNQTLLPFLLGETTNAHKRTGLQAIFGASA